MTSESMFGDMPLSSDLVQHIGKIICMPEGTVEFEYSSTKAFKRNALSGILIEIPANGHMFRIDRTSERVLRFFHSSPGTGTRVASIALDPLPDFEKAYFAFSWSPEEVKFYCGAREIEPKLLSAVGTSSTISFRIGQGGQIFQIGDDGVHVMGVRVYKNNQPILAPTAREVWLDTIKAINILKTGVSEEGFIFEVVQTSAILSMLVTGLENYTKTRLLELELEGITADWKRLLHEFSSNAERTSDLLAELESKTGVDNKSALINVINNRNINFQNYKHIKRAYKATYGIMIGEIGLDSQTLSKLQDFIRYRHRVVHVSPLLTVMNQDNVPPAEPVFANRELGDDAEACFKLVVEALHRATLNIRPSVSG